MNSSFFRSTAMVLAVVMMFVYAATCGTSLADDGYSDYTPLYGDVNSDNLVNTADATGILAHCCGLTSLTVVQKMNADVNCDGKITTADSTTVIRYVVGQIDSLPVVPDVVSVSFDRGTFPKSGTRVNHGESYSLAGRITTNRPILSVRLVITDISSGNVEADAEVNYSSQDRVYTYHTKNSNKPIDSMIRFAALSAGEKHMTLVCSMVDESDHICYESDFKVGFTFGEVAGYVFDRDDEPSATEARRVLKLLNSLDVSSRSGASVISEGVEYLGTDYSDMDCSKFVQSAYENSLDIDLPRVSSEQARYCDMNNLSVQLYQIKPGDIVFMRKVNCDCGRYHEIHHSALYLGSIDGYYYLMESASGVDGVVIRQLWGMNGDTWCIDSFGRPR